MSGDRDYFAAERRAIDHILDEVELPLVGEHFFGKIFSAIHEAKTIKTRRDQKYMAKRRDDAKAIDEAARELAKLILDYKKAWGISDSLGELLDDFEDEHIPFLTGERDFIGVTASTLGLVRRHFRNEAKEATPEAKGLDRFVATRLAPLFEDAFGRKPGYTYNDSVKSYSGDFLKFARAIFDHCGIDDYTDAAIVQALKRKKGQDA